MTAAPASRIVVPEMLAKFEPRLDILPDSQRRLWPELDAIPSDFVLYGGTGLALQLGHRVSEDFDFFSSSSFLEAFVNRGGVVKVAFLGGLDCAGWKARNWRPDRVYRSLRWWIWLA
jgi:Nucleotidyl transferase AbiEii toxin, Type IV TA system